LGWTEILLAHVSHEGAPGKSKEQSANIRE
jgi:hypothetical protein